MTMLKPKEMAERLGVTVRTLQIWDKKGTLKAHRTPTNRRYYTEEQYLEYIGQSTSNNRKNVAYARVSTYGQKDDLKIKLILLDNMLMPKALFLMKQLLILEVDLIITVKKWNQLLEEVMDNQVDTIFITYKDRFIRFGYEWFERLCKMRNTEIVVLNNIETSPTQEMVDDMISIVHVFSCRLYGLRKYKSKLKNDKSLRGGENDDSSSKGKALSKSNHEKGS